MKLIFKNDYAKYLALIAAIFLLRIFILAIYPLHHPSEARYATISMRMALTQNYLMPFYKISTPFFGKPPLAFWASALSFKIFGFNEFAGRLPHLLALMTVCFLVWRFFEKNFSKNLDKNFGKKNGAIAALLLSSCGLFYAMQSVMTEAFLLLGMTLISTSFWLQIQSQKPKNCDGYLVFLGAIIAMLAKGPVGIIMPCLPIFIYLLISKRWRELFQKFPILIGSFGFVALALPWFFLAEAKYPGFLQYFFVGENFDRFTKSSWSGDRYGRAHNVPFGAIWFFFFCGALPTSLVAIFKWKKIWQSSLQLIQEKSDHTFLFFLISFLTPLIFLTFMRNMIGTYGVFALTPFAIISAMIIAQKNWQKFVSFLGYFNIGLSLLFILIFLTKPIFIAQQLNYHAYLLKHLPQEASQNPQQKIYYLGDDYAIFTLSFYAKDRVENLNKKNFLEIINDSPEKKPEKKYVVGALNYILELPVEYQQKMHQITCAKKRQTCLYELKF